MAFQDPLMNTNDAGLIVSAIKFYHPLYLMTFEILIPLSSLINTRKLSLSAILLWYSGISMISALYVSSQKQKQASQLLIQICWMRKKAINYPTTLGLKAGLFLWSMDIFYKPLLDILIGEGRDYFHSLLTIRNGVSSILGSIFFGRSYSSSSPVALQRLRKTGWGIREVPMKSLVTLLTYHLCLLHYSSSSSFQGTCQSTRHSSKFSLYSSP